MQRLLIQTGDVFGMMTVIREIEGHKRPERGRRRIFLLRCSCGKKTSVYLEKLRSGQVISCGCASRPSMLRHGMYRTPTYKAWKHMKERCRNPTCAQYQDYGGRGISVDARWDQFETFLADMGERPFPEAQLDRIDNNGNYTPENCRWATRALQTRNTRRNLMVTLGSETMCLKDAAKKVGISAPTVMWRARKHNMSLQAAIDFYASS